MNFGKTTIDVMTSTAVIFLTVAIVAMIVGPAHRLAVHNDDVRTDDVRNIMEAILDMQTVDPARVDNLRSALESAGSPPRVMISGGAGSGFAGGKNTSCAGDHGVQCGDAILADTCVDIMPFIDGYISHIPVDTAAGFTSAATGYYIDFSPGTLEVGACNPETQSTIRLSRTFY